MYIEPEQKELKIKRVVPILVFLFSVTVIGIIIYKISGNTLTLSKSAVIPLATQEPVIVIDNTSSPIPTTTLPVLLPIKITAPTSSSSTATYNVGISFGDTLPSLSTVELNSRFDDIVSVGITWVRFDMAWDDIQYKNSTTYDWSAIDRIVAAANTHHLKLLPDLAYTPVWARSSLCPSSDKCEPANTSAFATYVQAAAKRYTSEGITNWEIWNEPNISGFWQPAPDPVMYTQLLQASYLAIKSENPSATVISAGLAPALTENGNIAPIQFLEDLYQDNAKPYFDAVGFHPYSYPVPPSTIETWSAWSQMNTTTPSLRSVMAEYGDSSKKIWMTEYGAPTGGPGEVAGVGDTNFYSDDHVTEDLQSQSIIQGVISDEESNWAGPIFIYSYKDLGTSSSTRENFFGIVRYDGSDKPVYSALKNLLIN